MAPKIEYHESAVSRPSSAPPAKSPEDPRLARFVTTLAAVQLSADEKLRRDKERRERYTAPAPVRSVAWTCSGDSILVGYESGLKVFKASSKLSAPATQLAARESLVELVEAHPTRNELAAVSLQDPQGQVTYQAVRFVDLRSSTKVPSDLCKCEAGAAALAWDPLAPDRLAVASKTGKIALHDIRKAGGRGAGAGPPRSALSEVHVPWEANALRFTRRHADAAAASGAREGVLLAAYGHSAASRAGRWMSGGLAVLRVPELAEVARYEGHVAPAVSLALSPDESIVATGGNDALVTLWDTATMSPVSMLYSADAPVTRVSFSFDGRFLAMTGGGPHKGLATADIAVLNQRDRHAHVITHRMRAGSGERQLGAVNDLAWSPVSHALAFVGEQAEAAPDGGGGGAGDYLHRHRQAEPQCLLGLSLAPPGLDMADTEE